MKCTLCRQREGYETLWERFTYFIFNHLFSNHIEEVRAKYFTKGFSEGLVRGREVERQQLQKVKQNGYI